MSRWPVSAEHARSADIPHKPPLKRLTLLSSMKGCLSVCTSPFHNPHFFQLEVALGAVGEVDSPVLLVLLILGAVVKRHGVVIYRVVELSVPVVSDIRVP